jgi:transcriptional regulator with XRE-family HTH domain
MAEDNTHIIPGSFGALVHDVRTGRDLSMAALGRGIGVDHARIWRIESGAVRPTATEVHGLVRELGLDAERALALAASVAPRGHGSAPEEAA